MKRRRKMKLSIDAGSCITLALMLLVLPLSWIVAALTAALVHEAGHLAGIYLLSEDNPEVTVQRSGAIIHAAAMSRGRELLCTLMGPAFGMLLICFARFFPRVAVCAGIQTVYNLLPVYPLDGGRALQCAASMLLPPGMADRACKWAEGLALAGIIAAGLYAAFILRLGMLPLLIGAVLLGSVIRRNSTCKESVQRVQ